MTTLNEEMNADTKPNAISGFRHVLPGEKLPVTDQWPDAKIGQWGWDENVHRYYLAGVRYHGEWIYIDPRNEA